MESYKTVSHGGVGNYEAKHSRFIASVFPVSDENEAVAIIEKLKKQYWDAKHNVYAYSLRNNNICRYSDDGEPSGTAGVPVLDVLKKREITDCLIVVTRYFGGVLLGTGGLVKAYTESAIDGINSAEICEMLPCKYMEIVCEYSDYDILSKLCQDVGGEVYDTDFRENITVKVKLKYEDVDIFTARLNERFCARLSAKEIGEGYLQSIIQKNL